MNENIIEKPEELMTITISGDIRTMYRLPNGSYADIVIDHHFTAVWKDCPPYSRVINICNIEQLNEQKIPIVDIKASWKPGVNALQKWWWENWNNEKVMDIDIKVKEYKTVTWVKMVSGETFLVDQSLLDFYDAFNRL